MSDEDLAAFFKANPERAVEMAKIATSFQGAAEKVPGPAAANNATANSKRPRERARVGDVVAAADFTDADDDDSIDPSPSQLRKKSRGASPSSSQLRRKSSGAGPSSSRQDTKPARGTGRRMGDNNPFAETFGMDRRATGEPLGTTLLIAAVLIDGPFQREDKAQAHRHHLVVKSAIANSFGIHGETEFEAIELDNDVYESTTKKLMDAFCIAKAELSRVIMLATIARLKAWLDMNIFAPGGPHPSAAGTYMSLHVIIVMICNHCNSM